MKLLQELARLYHIVNTDNADPRTNHWFLVGSWMYLVSILLCYVYVVTSLGPSLMTNRKPFHLKTVIIFFNLFQIIYNAYIFAGGLRYGWGGYYKFLCQPVDYSMDENAIGMAHMVWHYYMCKLIDLLDTVIFVLRKKNGQLNYLHITHHFGMPFVAFICVKYYPGGHGTFTGIINTLVHMVMYSYYLVASLGPQYQRYLWWKKYLTLAQMTQFLLIAIHSSCVFILDCDLDKRPYYYLLPNTLMMFVMFASFYRRTYMRKEASKHALNNR